MKKIGLILLTIAALGLITLGVCSSYNPWAFTIGFVTLAGIVGFIVEQQENIQ